MRLAAAALFLALYTLPAAAQAPDVPAAAFGSSQDRGAAFLNGLDVRRAEHSEPIGDARTANVTADTFLAKGSSVAGYFTANKFGTGAGFGLVAEVEDVTGVGPLWGMEIDAFSIGEHYPDTWLRRGLGVVIGVNQGRKVPTAIGWGIQVLPFYRDRGYVSVNYGVSVDVPAKIAAISVMAGERVCLESSGRVCLRFNPTSNAVEIVDGERVLASWSVQQ